MKNNFVLFITLWSVLLSCTSNNNDKGLCLNVCSTKNTQCKVAPTPPMGWNSFDAYDIRINEKEFKAIVDYMADNLKQHGWAICCCGCFLVQ